ncbi:unnamed protein product [Absidia cylindrospora]
MEEQYDVSSTLARHKNDSAYQVLYGKLAPEVKLTLVNELHSGLNAHGVHLDKAVGNSLANFFIREKVRGQHQTRRVRA